MPDYFYDNLFRSRACDPRRDWPQERSKFFQGAMTMEQETEISPAYLLRSTVEIVSSYVRSGQTAPSSLPALIKTVAAALSDVTVDPFSTKPAPAVPIAESIQPEYIVCLEDGRRLRTMKRYLRSRFGMTPEEYRERWGLPPDYPMVAPEFSKLRSDRAREMGLGRKRASR